MRLVLPICRMVIFGLAIGSRSKDDQSLTTEADVLRYLSVREERPTGLEAFRRAT